MFLTFEEFQDLILKHPLLGDDEWEFFNESTEHRPYYRAIQPRRYLYRLEVLFTFDRLVAEEHWWVHYYHQGHGNTLDKALKSFFFMWKSQPC